MKDARASDYWRKIEHSQKGPIALNDFLFNGIKTLGASSLPTKGSLTVLCGANGTGKSTILETLYLAITGQRPELSFGSGSRYNEARVSAKVSLIIDGDEHHASFSYGASQHVCTPSKTGLSINATWLNPGATSAFLQRKFTSIKNFGEVLDGLAPREFTRDELLEISYLVGKNYSTVTVWEIEEDDSEMLKDGLAYSYYFTVVTDGLTYSSEDMGLGEYALFLLYWEAKNILPNTLLLIEEIEAHISHRSQIHVLNFLAKRCAENRLWTLITTHSPAILRVVPQSNIKLCYRSGGVSLVTDSPTESQLANTLGIALQCKGVIIVEDAAAKSFLIALLSNLGRDALLFFEIIIAKDGESHITNLRTLLPPLTKGLRVVGVYDADKVINGAELNHRAVKLPGAQSPELEIIPVLNEDFSAIAARLGRLPEEVQIFLSDTSGFNSHDLFAQFCRRLAISYDQAMSAIIPSWLSFKDNNIKATSFIENLSMVLDIRLR